MSLPYFFIASVADAVITLDEDTSKHVIQVLRKKTGDQILLTDGKGTKALAEISDDHRKHCAVTVLHTTKEEAKKKKVAIAISLVKNTSRFEWFLEKATEIGVTEIIPLVCERTEKEKFRFDRMQQILISALLQSQQSWLPLLHEPTLFLNVVKERVDEQKFIAHCVANEKSPLINYLTHPSSAILLIGPEGDFTEGEIENALQHGFLPVSLGETRLRTETAGMVGATLLCVG